MRPRLVLLVLGVPLLWSELPPSSSTHLRDFCSYPADSGPCGGSMHRVFYNSTSQKCEMFRYGGCLGNLNRFITLEECRRSCGKIDKPGFCLPSPEGLRVECSTACIHDGNCPGAQKCCSYGCALRCSDPIEDLCRLPAETGPCDNVVWRWFYDWRAQKCQKFHYGGCAGNKNNFRTHQACQSRCAQPGSSERHCALDEKSLP